MIGVCIPAHNEERLLGPCLDALATAARHPALGSELVSVLVVLDACDDASARLCSARSVRTLAIDARNVGKARHAGAHQLILEGARWLAFTDADSEVAPNWLAVHAAIKADAVCGRIELAGWHHLPEQVRAGFQAYRAAQHSEDRVHGANLGVDAAVYRAVGGFPPLRSGEDHALVQRLLAYNFHVVWSQRLRVSTSARDDFRAPGGLGQRLKFFAQGAFLQ